MKRVIPLGLAAARHSAPVLVTAAPTNSLVIALDSNVAGGRYVHYRPTDLEIPSGADRVKQDSDAARAARVEAMAAGTFSAPRWPPL